MAFKTLKELLIKAPILAFLECGDDSEKFILDVDAFSSRLGAVLCQARNSRERSVSSHTPVVF